jgi:hypothetical protein
MIVIKPEFLGKDVWVGMARDGNEYSAICLDNCTQGDLELLASINHHTIEIIPDKKKPEKPIE